jgi:phosphoribosylformylglycinamidine synthase
MGKWDPYVMAKVAVDEAYRNLISVGGGLTHAAILDNFCWGDSKNAGDLGGLVRAAEGCLEAALAYELPFISGKDSFNNTWKSPDGYLHSIPPTLLVSAIGVVEDVRQCVTSGLKTQKSLLYLIGDTGTELTGSLVSSLWGEASGKFPDVNFVNAKALYKKLQMAMKYRLVLACHDLSEGGLAVAASEMAFGGEVGVGLDLSGVTQDPVPFLFAETPSRFLVEVEPTRKGEFETIMGGRGVQLIGETVREPVVFVFRNGETLFKEKVELLKNAWKGTLKGL